VVKARHTVQVNPRLKDEADLYRLHPADMKKLTTVLDTEFTKFERRQFASEGSAGGKAWAPLSPAYAKAKKKAVIGTRIKTRKAILAGKKIMQRTGTGRKTLVNKRDALHIAEWYLKPRPAVELGTGYSIFSFHTGPNKNPRLPDRDVMQHTDAQALKYTDHVESYYREVVLPRIMRTLLAAWRRRRSGPRAR
jgi:hypothetical protein